MRRHFQCRENPGEEVSSPISRAFWSLLLSSPLSFDSFLFVMHKEIELRSLNDLEEKLREVIFPFDAVVPDITKEYFTVRLRLPVR